MTILQGYKVPLLNPVGGLIVVNKVKEGVIKSTSYYISPSVRIAVRRASFDLSEKHGKHISASALVERAIRQFLKLKD